MEKDHTIPPSSFWQPHWHSTSCPEAVLPPASLASALAVRLRYGLRAAMWCCVSDSKGKVSVVGGVCRWLDCTEGARNDDGVTVTASSNTERRKGPCV